MNAAEPMAGIVARLVAQIEAGAATWEMPWRNFAATGWPTNAATGHSYHGGNAVILSVAALDAGYPGARWATYKQWAGLGAQVRRGEHATTGIYWHTQPAADTPDANDDDDSDATPRPPLAGSCGHAPSTCSTPPKSTATPTRPRRPTSSIRWTVTPPPKRGSPTSPPPSAGVKATRATGPPSTVS